MQGRAQVFAYLLANSRHPDSFETPNARRELTNLKCLAPPEMQSQNFLEVCEHVCTDPGGLPVPTSPEQSIEPPSGRPHCQNLASIPKRRLKLDDHETKT
eukprot:CAMPEP_0198330972 /NCGR_PEP_ID=MMETSP1450-20131203/17266_1 /TAXON_ID=753684 ORGANISM="Madagascaria erythrocladiodes, Strain CCMP3234" /NCGR_SAMPLE_ID=MMETSP1450 /ASSEMBLY_ACC=CAM_ASM_001115 /LENGTH=99 /DNA_ID=CAMNT_0044035309 /DNA_START=572 /DNA_END=871 /DNA_ORIENTATION=+